MTNLSASDVAARRIREARQARKWTVKDLAAACKKAGVPYLTAPVITNLETRRRPGREITAEELVALARVLDVPAALLLTPFGGEELQVLPGEVMGPIETARWLTDEGAWPAVREAVSLREETTERMLRYRDSPLTILRQIGAVTRQLAFHDRAITGPLAGTPTATVHENTVTIMSIRLLHLLASLDALGYEPPPLPGAMEILARHGMPSTLAELEADGDTEEEVPDGASA